MWKLTLFFIMDNVYIEIITQIGALIALILTPMMGIYTQRKTKQIELKMQQAQQQEKRQAKVYSEQIGGLLGELWNLLYRHHFDRVYVVRPHPQNRHEFLSVQFEVRRNGISSTKDIFTNQPMDEIPHLCGRLIKEDYIVISNTMNTQDVQDAVARSIFAQNGTKSAIINRMEDKDNKWTGSLFCTFMHKADVSSEEIQNNIKEVSSKIQLILPEFNNYYEL